MACAMFCISTVLPVRGGETIRARWPLPIGAIRSITRVEMSSCCCGVEVDAFLVSVPVVRRPVETRPDAVARGALCSSEIVGAMTPTLSISSLSFSSG